VFCLSIKNGFSVNENTAQNHILYPFLIKPGIVQCVCWTFLHGNLQV